MATAQNGLYYSPLAADPDLAELVELFVAEMPARIAALETGFAAGDRDLLAYAAHQLKGAAGSYGFLLVTHFAATLEQAIKSGEGDATVQQCLRELAETCRCCRAGLPEN